MKDETMPSERPMANRADRQHVLDMVRGMRERIQRSPGLSSAPFSDDGWRIIEEALTEEAASATQRPNAVPLLKRLREQRDEVADVLRDIVGRNLLSSYPVTEGRAKAILEKCPSYEQQLRNIADGIGMDYDDLLAALQRLPTDRSDPE